LEVGLKIATWNVNGLRARLEFVLHWLRARQPDVVGIQEIKLTEERFPRAEIEAAGYHAAIHGQKAWNGVAILSREPAVVTRQGLPGQEDLGARLLTAEVGGLSFITIYVPNGKSVGHQDFPRKLAWLDALREHLDTAHDPRDPVVLCGDFNICPAGLDSWNEAMLAGKIFHTREERERFKSLLDWGLIDLYRDAHPETQAFSWWDYRGGAFHRGQGLRIDFVLGTQAVRTRVRNVEIDRDYRKKKDGLISSDHTAVIVDLE
jgi:exodeoxyribonuclease-3